MINNIITVTERNSILNDMERLLDEYNYEYSICALDEIVDEWASNKSELIEAFKKHPNYLDGKFMIVFSTNYERAFDKKAIYKFSEWLMNNINVGNIPDNIKSRSVSGNAMPIGISCLIEDLDNLIHERTVTKELAERVENAIPEVKPHIGERASRLINKICTYLGFNKHPDYNREYAKFADALSPMTIKRHTILSINPLDYLTMSFGNSWASCHTIDKNNKRNMPSHYSGCYSSGTISYMLDGASMVLYTVDASYDGEDYWDQPKITRQMFHWGAEKLVQGRLYPQDNDGDKDAYAPYRNIVQQIMSTIFDFPNLWSLSRGVEAARKYIISEGTHYCDYNHYENCTLSKKSGSHNDEDFIVGHRPICIDCGREHDVEDNISCCANQYVCANCGQRLDEDEVRWVGDTPYCVECVEWCERCQEYEIRENVTFIECEDRYVCEWCLDNYYNRCEECGEYYPNDCTTFVESIDGYVCDDCLENDFTCCEGCGEYFRTEDMNEDDDTGYFYCDECYETIKEQRENEEEDEEC
jgi:hypothetical protein